MMNSFGKQIAIEDEQISDALDGGKNNNKKKKEIIEMLKKINTSNPNILSQINNMQNNLDNTCNIIHQQYTALYNILEYLNSIQKPNSSKKILDKINQLEDEEKYLKTI